MEFLDLWDLILSGVIRGGLYVLMAMGLSLVFGVMNIPNFAHGEFYMIGAYTAYFIAQYLVPDPFICLLFAGLSGFVFGAVAEKLTFAPLRKYTKGNWIMNTFMVTAGITFILQNVVQATIGVNYYGINEYWGGTINTLGGIGISVDRLLAFALAMLAVLVFWLFLTYTKTGNAIRAVSESEIGARLIGINISFIHTLTFALSCMLVAMAGAVLLPINPAYPTMGLQPLYKSWFVVILVGMGNVSATLAGGLIVGLIEAFSAYYLGTGWMDVASLSVICMILIFKPSGIFGSEVRGVWEQ
jgi:branched-chain amino acid transport system permease protein